MSKKLAIVAPLLAIAAFALTPVAAQAAEPHWYVNGVLLKEGRKVPTISFGKVDFRISGGQSNCKWEAAGEIENPTGGLRGIDAVTQWHAYECIAPGCPGTITLIGENVSKWLTFLRRSGEAVQDQWTGVEMRNECTVGEEKAFNELFHGELFPTVHSGTSAAKPAFEEFNDAESGELTSEIGPASLVGKDKMIGFEEQEVIGAR
jgi:hypothetical protein